MQKFQNTLHETVENFHLTVHRLINWLLFIQSNVHKDTSDTKVFYKTSLKLKRRKPKRWLIITIVNGDEGATGAAIIITVVWERQRGEN